MFKLLVLLALLFNLSCSNSNVKRSNLQPQAHQVRHYSQIVQDSFIIDVYVPDTTGEKPNSSYPVVYVLDANLYFEIYATLLKQYNSVGLLPRVILVGVGYPTFQKMDSLRQRDYTYPEALSEYEMPVSGKGDAFRKAFMNEFIPLIDSLYSTDTSKRILSGHSLGGYFTLYSMYQDALLNSSTWMGYIAASPSLHYNNFYLVNKFDSLTTLNLQLRKAFISYGSEEASEMHYMSLDSLLLKWTVSMEQIKGMQVKSVSFTNMGHMDTQLPTFIKGLQWILQDTSSK